MLLMNPSEKVLLDSIAALTPHGKERLVRKVKKAAAKSGLYYKRRDQHPVGLVPLVMDRGMRGTIHSLTRSAFKLQMNAPALYWSDFRGFSKLFKLEPRTKAWLEKYRGRRAKPWQHILRPDYGMRMRSGSLSPVMFELNSLMLGGIQIQSAALEVVQGCILPHLGISPGKLGIEPSMDLLELLKRWLLEGLKKSGGPRGGGIAFIEDLPPGDGFSELPRITRFFKDAGIRAEHGDPRELRLRGEEVWLRDMPVAYAYRDFSFEDTGGPRNPRLKAFRTLWEAGRVGPGFPADFDQKGILECFTSPDFESLFSRSEVRRLREHVPWTRVLTQRRTKCLDGRGCDLPKYALKTQERLVLKPSWGSGGEGILIGRSVKSSRWRRAIERGIAKPGSIALQEHIDNPAKPTAYLRGGRVRVQDCRYTIGSFFDGSRFGYHLRVSPKEIVNVAQGGALAPLYIR